MKFLSAHLFMPLILHVFYKRKRDSPLFMFPSGQGRQVCSPAHPCAPAVQPQGSRASSLRAGGGCAIQICISSLSLYGAWMTLNNQKILLVPFLICSSFESPPEDRDSFWLKCAKFDSALEASMFSSYPSLVEIEHSIYSVFSPLVLILFLILLQYFQGSN